MDKGKYDIFISYRRVGGKNYARTLKPELEKRGFRVFLDFDELKDGVFDKRIMDAISEAPIFLVILSKGALDRCANDGDWVREEILYADKTNRHIVPVEVDKTFREFPENLPNEVKSVLGPHQFSQIDTETLLQESIDKMVRERIKPYVTNISEAPSSLKEESSEGAEIHIEVDADCDLYRFKKLLKTLYAGKDNIVHLMPGKHKIEVVSKEYADIKDSQVITIPSIQYSDFIEISLSERIESKKQEEIRLQEEQRRSEEAKRKAEEDAKRKAEEARRKAEYEAWRKAEEEEERRKLAEEFKRKEEEKKRKEEAAAKRRAEEEKRRAEEEAKRKTKEKKEQQALLFYKAEEFSKAFDLFKQLAEQGNAKAQVAMGNMYRLGQSVNKDVNEAIKWYKKASLQNNSEAAFWIGIIYQRDLGNHSEAIKWFQKSVSLGYNDAKDFLKQAQKIDEYWNRKVIKGYVEYQKGNFASALSLFKEAISLGDVEGNEREYRWYIPEANDTNIDARYMLGQMYENGEGIEKNLDEALLWYTAALNTSISVTRGNATIAIKRVTQKLFPQEPKKKKKGWFW
jgi:TPR repeat protein